MRLFDSHAHLCDGRFDADRTQLIGSLAAKGVLGVLECATGPEDLHVVVELAAQYAQIWAAVGVHPHEADAYSPQVETDVRTLAAQPKVVAIGEIGLDYHYDFSPRAAQQAVLDAQLVLAHELGLPVVLHSREATQDMLAALRRAPGVRGVLHCFSGSVETARQALDLGLHLGVGGSLTFKNAVKALEVAAYAPLDRLLVETDSPYLAPVPLRGQRNDPSLVRLVAEKLAAVRGISLEKIAEATWQNTVRLFGMDVEYGEYDCI